jgi:glucokinase
VPVFVDDDATVAALAEAHDDELSMVSRNLVMLTVGTGVGGGLILGGRIYRGATDGAGELGHTRIGASLVDAVPAM